MKKFEMTTRTVKIGQAGVYAVASQLLLRGVNVMMPAVDEGADLIAGAGVRMQIKSARMLTSKDRRVPGYYFNLQGWTVDERGKYHKKTRNWNHFVDYFVMWGVDENRFWIVPPSVLGSRQSVSIPSVIKLMRISREDVQRLTATGLTRAQVGAQLGVSVMTVSRLDRGLLSRYETSASVAIREFEDRWDLLTNAAVAAQEIGDLNRLVALGPKAPEKT